MALVIGIQLVRWITWNRVEEHQRWVAHTHEVLATTERLLAAMHTAESTQRGFLLTRDSMFLAQHAGSVAEVPRVVARLGVLTEDNPNQQTRVATLSALADRKLAHMRSTVELGLDGEFDMALQRVLSGEGFSLSQAIRAEVDAMRGEELELLAARSGHAGAASRFNVISAVASGALNVGLLIGLYVLFRLLWRRRAEHESRLEALLVREREARTEAERATRLKDEFLATISHELRTPLTSLLGWTQILRHRPPDDASLARGLEVIERNARAQTRMIENLLDLSRIAAGNLELATEHVDLGDVARAAIERVEPAAARKGQSIALEVDEAARPVHGDRARLEQALGYVLDNALKFSSADRCVEVRVEPGGQGTTRIAVRDQGEGIARSELPGLFDRFHQVDGSPRRRHGGLGIGLAIARQLVELHGGKVDAESAGAGHGSTFTLTLPVELEHHPPRPEHSAVASPAAP